MAVKVGKRREAHEWEVFEIVKKEMKRKKEQLFFFDELQV